MPDPTIAEIVETILQSCIYWPPELRVQKILAYLEAHGEPLYVALRALPAGEQEACGVDLITPRRPS